MGLRPAVILTADTAARVRHWVPILSVTVLMFAGATIGFAAAAGTLLAKASTGQPGHKSLAPKPGHIVDLDWKELLPEGERAHFTAVAPAPVHDYRGEGGPPAVQAQDFNVNKSLDGATVRLPGFIVPLEAVKNGAVSEFLLVPYF